jgi:hypothetical protein
MEWQLIESATRDDTPRLFFDEGWIFLGAWSDYFGNFHPDDRPVKLYGDGEGPTHWMPLPDPPSFRTYRHTD